MFKSDKAALRDVTALSTVLESMQKTVMLSAYTNMGPEGTEFGKLAQSVAEYWPLRNARSNIHDIRFLAVYYRELGAVQ